MTYIFLNNVDLLVLIETKIIFGKLIIEKLWVKRALRKAKLGSKLIQLAFERANFFGCDEIILATNLAFGPEISLYLKSGFVLRAPKKSEKKLDLPFLDDFQINQGNILMSCKDFPRIAKMKFLDIKSEALKLEDALLDITDSANYWKTNIKSYEIELTILKEILNHALSNAANKWIKARIKDNNRELKLRKAYYLEDLEKQAYYIKLHDILKK